VENTGLLGKGEDLEPQRLPSSLVTKTVFDSGELLVSVHRDRRIFQLWPHSESSIHISLPEISLPPSLQIYFTRVLSF
jgi:hypothetical protein